VNCVGQVVLLLYWNVGHDGLGMWLGWVLHNNGLCGFYRSCHVRTVVKCRRLKLCGQEARMDELRNPYKLLYFLEYTYWET